MPAFEFRQFCTMAHPRFDYAAALVRGLPASFISALQLEKTPIDAGIASCQHDDYNRLIRTLVPQIIELPADEALPDCVFVEDTVRLHRIQTAEYGSVHFCEKST